MDYSKWAEIARQEPSEDVGQKEWADMTAEERREAAHHAAEQERRLREARRAHEVYRQEMSQEAEAEAEDESWAHDVDMDSYQDFTVKRVSRVIKARGAKLFQAGDLHCAERQWSGALLLLLKVGLGWPAASELYVQLKCNLAMLYIKSERWAEARQATSAALEVDPRCEKALYRRALVHTHHAEWSEARHGLEALLAMYPANAEAQRRLAEVRGAMQRQAVSVRRAAAGGLELAGAVEELAPDGTLRKVAVLAMGIDRPDGERLRWSWPWGREEWLGQAIDKAVLTVHVVVRSMGGEELFSTRARAALPETPQERDELRMIMREVAELDDLAGKAARTPSDFVARERMQPMRWRYGDPCVYAGFDLAARSMRLEERAVFEIDQPLLEPSVAEFYRKDGGVARVAGLPSFQHSIEERKLTLLAEELTEWELDLENHEQRTVRVDLELVDIALYRDLSPGRCGEYLLRIAHTGQGGGRLRAGMRVQGDFVVAGALSGIALYSVEKAVWILGSEGRESYVTTPGSRPVWIPSVIGKMFRDATWALLYAGARLEARIQAGPSPMELNPKFAKDLHHTRAWGHRPPTAITLKITRVFVDGDP